MESERFLDHSEIGLIYRTIKSAGKDPADPAIWAEYKEGYVRLLRALRFHDLEPASPRLQ
jgi:hypothetical protein